MKWILGALAFGLALTAGAAASLAQDDETTEHRSLTELLKANVDDLDLATILETPLDVWTASRTEQKTREAPAIITTVTREQIAAWGYRSVAEVLQHLLGFYVVDDHTAPNLAVRGISGGLNADSSIVKVLIDGHSVAFHSTAGNLLGPELIPLSAIERIEIVRGPASALFGADAFLGVINIKTRRGKSLDGAVAGLGMGVAGRHLATDLDGSVGGESGDVDVLVAARRTSQDLSGIAVPLSPANNDGGREVEGLDQQSTSALARVTYRLGEGSEVGVFGYYSAMDRGAELSSLFQGPGSSQSRVSVSQWRAGLFLDQALGARWRLSARGSAFRGAPGDDNRLEIGSNSYYLRRQFGFRGADLDAQLEWRPSPQGRLAWLSGHDPRLMAGASFLADDEQLPSYAGVAKQATRDVAAGGTIDAISLHQPRKTFLNTGAYLQGMVNVFADRLGVTGGLRYDWHNIYGPQLTERVGLVSRLGPTLNAKLLYGGSFKAPSPLLLYAVPSSVGDVVGNAQLKPQRARTTEFQLVYDPSEILTLSSNLTYTVLSDKTEFVQQGIHKEARNVARAATLSWESLADVKYRGLVRGYLSFEVQRTVRRTGEIGYIGDLVGSQGVIYPTQMVHAGIITRPSGWPVRAAVAASYIGPRRASDTNILLNGGPYELPAYVQLEAGLSTVGFHPFGLNKSKEISFSLTGKNLLGVTGPTPGFSGVDYPLAPRTFFLQTNLTL